MFISQLRVAYWNIFSDASSIFMLFRLTKERWSKQKFIRADISWTLDNSAVHTFTRPYHALSCHILSYLLTSSWITQATWWKFKIKLWEIHLSSCATKASDTSKPNKIEWWVNIGVGEITLRADIYISSNVYCLLKA